jgi:hypothetical protein
MREGAFRNAKPRTVLSRTNRRFPQGSAGWFFWQRFIGSASLLRKTFGVAFSHLRGVNIAPGCACGAASPVPKC